MKTDTWVSLAAVTLLGGLLSVGWIHAHRAHEWSANRAQVDAQRARAEADLRRAEQRIIEAEKEKAAASAALNALSAPTKAAPVTPAVESDPRPPNIVERLRNDPATQALWLRSRRSALATRYGPLMRQLSLSPEQRTRFEAIAIRREEREMDLHAAEATNGISSSEPAMLVLRDEMKTEYDNSLRELLGEDGRQQMKAFERTTLIRDMVNGIAGGAVVVARAPLTSEQGEQLIQIMVSASNSYQDGGKANVEDLDWELIDAEARRILSHDQFAAFNTMEPPLPVGARFQAQFYRRLADARKADASKWEQAPEN